MASSTDSALPPDVLRASAAAAIATTATLPEGVDATLPASSSNRRSAAGTMPPLAALRVADPTQYIERRELTRGGMGRILSAYDTKLRRRVAIKELRFTTPDLAMRFEREALLTARLQHPSIVSIHDAGQWTTGEPFFVMRLVPGRALDQVVAETRSLDDKLALLPHVLAVADALAYAHGEGIIHRDLKPHNVMVGEFGETVVIDWGLAKDLREVETATTLAPAEANAMATGSTELGEVLGTPAYMPPEQARGETVDMRADVYAIGALLYHLLAGVPPYQGTTSAEVLAGVKAGEHTALAGRDAGIPADLLAIVTRAMQFDPGARYPSARELADDLRRFLAGQLVSARRYSRWQLARRWLRRHRLPVVLTAITATIVAVVGAVSVQRIVVEQRRAVRAEKVADASLIDSEELQRFMVFDLVDKLEPLGRLDILSTVAEKTSTVFQKRPLDELGDLLERSMFERNVGDILQAKRDLAGARASYEASYVHARIYAMFDPGARREVFITADRMGEIMSALGDNAAAIAWEQSAVEYIDDDAKDDLVVANIKLGDWLDNRGDHVTAAAHYRRALANASSENPRHMLVCHDRIATALSASGDKRGALAEGRIGLGLATELVTDDDLPSQMDLAKQHGRVAEYLYELGDAHESLEQARLTLQLTRRLSAANPSNLDWAREVTLATIRVAQAEIATGAGRAALARLRARLVDLAADADVDTETLGTLHALAGDALVALRDRSAAEEYAVALAYLEQFATSSDFADAQDDLTELRNKLAAARKRRAK